VTETTVSTWEPASRAALHEPLSAERQARWRGFGKWEQRFFPNVVGLEFEEVRTDYARFRLPYRDELLQPAGVVHGGAIATLIDTVVVPAIASAYEVLPVMMTVDMQIRFLSAAGGIDLVAEGWITKRGRSVCFCQAEVRNANDGGLIAEGWTVYKVSAPPEGSPEGGRGNGQGSASGVRASPAASPVGQGAEVEADVVGHAAEEAE
jgi:uncharacterized protein (TIGR00369 family)